MNVLVIPPKFGSYNVRNTVPVSPGFCELGISSPQYADTDEVASTNNEGSVRGDILQDESTLIFIFPESTFTMQLFRTMRTMYLLLIRCYRIHTETGISLNKRFCHKYS